MHPGRPVYLLPAPLIAACVSLACPTSAPAARVAVFDNPAYVDTTSRSSAAESDNIQATLAWLGHRVIPFTTIEASQLQAVISSVNVVVIPELENRDLGQALSEPARQVLRDFVARGRTLLVHGTSDQRAPRFLNAVFGWNLTSGTVGTGTIGPDALGTPFAGAPNRITANQRTRGLDIPSLPKNAAVLYVNRTRAPVAQISHGSGRVLYFGWDWYQAAPRGDRDGGWLRLLVAAIGDNAPCDGKGGIDLDGDGIIDQCEGSEGCANIDGRRQIARGAWIELANPGPGGFQTLFFNGTFRLPSGATFRDLDPRRTPFVFTVLGADGTPQVAQTFPIAGPRDRNGGWRYNAKDARWVFEDPSGNSANGFVRVVAKDLGPDSPGRVRFRAVGEKGKYPVKTTATPLTVRIVVGDARQGQCAEVHYAEQSCVMEKKERSIVCRF
jgi:hypothetical protein